MWRSMYGALGNIVLPSCEDKFKVKTVCVCVREREVCFWEGERVIVGHHSAHSNFPSGTTQYPLPKWRISEWLEGCILGKGPHAVR